MKIAVVAGIFIALNASLLFAEPYIAVREGLKCSACHTNLTGGGKRNRMGTGYGAIDLPWKPADLQSNKIPHYFSLFNDVISFGGDFRVLSRSTFSEGQLEANSFQTDKSNLYLQADLIPNRITFYLDETIAPGGAQTREIFAMLHNLPGRGWIKAGKFLHPYGLRLEDDSTFLREVTGFNFNNPDTGLEIGFEPGSLLFAASVTNGTSSILDNDTSKQLVSTLGYVGDHFRAGASASYNKAGDDIRKAAGIWTGLRLKRLVFLGEADLVHEEAGDDTRDQVVTYAELDYEIVDGWNVKLAYEYFDPNQDIDENERDRVIIGVEPFLTSFVQVQLFYRFNQSIPQNIPQNADELVLRLHIYF
ncbi:hypothetical protein L0222_07460 [bacterium]|nr:hypothetical protein [bacterium]